MYGAPITMKISVFYKNSHNVIDWHPISGDITKWKSTNIEYVLTSGHNIHFELFPKIINRLDFIESLDSAGVRVRRLYVWITTKRFSNYHNDRTLNRGHNRPRRHKTSKKFHHSKQLTIFLLSTY